MIKIQMTNFKKQINNNNSNSKKQELISFWNLDFLIWNLFDICILFFGVFLQKIFQYQVSI